MGTSTRNKGQSGHTPLVPSWLEEDTQFVPDQPITQNLTTIPPNGDENRFRGPRTSFTHYISEGGRDSGSMKRTISSYVNRSLGGSLKATTRLGTARGSTARLYGILNNLSGGGAKEIAQQLSLGNIEGLPASDFFVKIAAFICPDGGPNDEGIARSAYYDAIADDPDLYGKPTESLTHEECESVLQNFMSKVVLEQLMNDIANKTITLPNNINEVAHIEEKVEQMIKQSVSDAFVDVRNRNIQITNSEAQKITDSIYQKTYEILEGLGNSHV